MRKFIHKTLILSAIIILAAIAGELIVRNRPNPYSYKSGYLDTHAADIQTLILGSSHTYYGVLPSHLAGKAFNLANISQTPDIDLALLQKYWPALHNLSTVIVPVSYFSFREPALEDGDAWPLVSKYQIHMGIKQHSPLSIYNFEIFNFDGFSGALRNIFLHRQQNECDSLGFGLGFGIESRDTAWERKGEARAIDNTFPHTSRVEEVTKIYESIIGQCRERGIRVILVATPVWPTFLAHTDSLQLREMDSIVTVLAKNPDVDYLNFMTDPDFTDPDFHDSDHLSPAGAAKLTDKLNLHMLQTNHPSPAL